MKPEIINELEHELMQQCTLLAGKKKEDWFAVPKNYFETAEQQIIFQIEIQKTKKDAEFTVPEKYFDELSNNIWSKIKNPESNNRKNRIVKFVIAATAVAASLLLIFYFNHTDLSDSGLQVAMKRNEIYKYEISQQAAQQFVSEQPQTIDEQFLETNIDQLQLLSSSDISNIPSSTQTDLSAYNEILVDASEVDFNLITSLTL